MRCVLFTWSFPVLCMWVQSWSNMHECACMLWTLIHVHTSSPHWLALFLVMITHWQWPYTSFPSSTELEVSTHSPHIRWPSCDHHVIVRVLLLECNEQCTLNLRQLNSCIPSSGVVQVFISYSISCFRFLKVVLLILSTCLHLHQ